jgi:hypothetical protein
MNRGANIFFGLLLAFLCAVDARFITLGKTKFPEKISLLETTVNQMKQFATSKEAFFRNQPDEEAVRFIENVKTYTGYYKQFIDYYRDYFRDHKKEILLDYQYKAVKSDLRAMAALFISARGKMEANLEADQKANDLKFSLFKSAFESFDKTERVEIDRLRNAVENWKDYPVNYRPPKYATALGVTGGLLGIANSVFTTWFQWELLMHILND